MTTRIYLVDNGQIKRLVRAANQPQALRHVANDFDVRVATQDDLETLLPQGVKVEKAKSDIPAPGYMGNINGPGCDPDVP